MFRQIVAFIVSLAVLAGANATWAQTKVSPDKDPTPAQKALLDAATGSRMPNESAREYQVALADINGDGRPDLIFQIRGMLWCGTAGCTSGVLLATQNGFAAKQIYLPHFRFGVTVLPSKRNGMNDLRFDDATVIFRWDGKEYR